MGAEKRMGSVMGRDRLNVITIGRGLLVGNGTCLAKSNQSLQERLRYANQFKGSMYMLLFSCLCSTV